MVLGSSEFTGDVVFQWRLFQQVAGTSLNAILD